MVSIIPFKNIGDELSDDNLNAIVSLLRNNKVLNENITVKNGDVQGEYGKYTFNLQSTTIVDNGVLITDETLTNLGTVKLSNPSFSNATYTLYLTVYTMEDANIMIEETTSNIEETTLEIELENGTAVNIPFNTLNYSCIVGFDAIVSIKQDKPEIKGAYVTGINITATKDTIQTGDTTTFTFKATDLDTHGVPGKTIKVYKNSTLWQTLTTDNNGECSVSYTGEGSGLINIECGYGGMILSETYDVYDCIMVDSATPYDSSKWSAQSNVSVSSDDTGTTITQSTGTGGALFYAKNISLENFVGEFDLKYEVQCFLYNNNADYFRINPTGTNNGVILTENTFHTLKFECNNGTLTLYELIDGTYVSKKTISITGSPSRFFFGLYNAVSSGASFTFKNFKIYPI